MATVKEAALWLEVSEARVKVYLKQGRIRGARKVKGSWRIPEKSLDAFADKPRPNGRPKDPNISELDRLIAEQRRDRLTTPTRRWNSEIEYRSGYRRR